MQHAGCGGWAQKNRGGKLLMQKEVLSGTSRCLDVSMDCSAHPWAEPIRCAAGPACGCPNSFRTNLSNPGGFVHATLSARKAKRPARGRFAFLAERVGFEPTVRLHVRLISSQVHSTTLPPLRRGSHGQREPASLRGASGRDKRAGHTPASTGWADHPAFFFASRSQVSTTVSGFSDTDSMPWSINHSARSG